MNLVEKAEYTDQELVTIWAEWFVCWNPGYRLYAKHLTVRQRNRARGIVLELAPMVKDPVGSPAFSRALIRIAERLFSK